VVIGVILFLVFGAKGEQGGQSATSTTHNPRAQQRPDNAHKKFEVNRDKFKTIDDVAQALVCDIIMPIF
jgi:hypothetical protein